MTFTEDRLKMLDFYYETENQFLELIRIIPLSNDNKTHSPRLYNILQSSCGQIENIMRLLCENFSKPLNDKNFPEYYKLLNDGNTLARQLVLCRKNGEYYKPFEICEHCISPFWWRGYNGTKHKLPDGLRQGNIENTINAMAGLYSLHCFAWYAEVTPKNLFKKDHWNEEDVLYYGNNQLIETTLDNRPSSKLFYSASKFNSEGASI